MPTSDRLPREAPYGQREATERFIQQRQQRQGEGPTPQGGQQAGLEELPLASPPQGITQQGTQFPDEPVTAGLPIGPGAGPEAIPAVHAPPDNTEALVWVPLLPVLEALAEREGASGATIRQLIRRVRSQAPPDAFDQHVARGSTRQPGQPETQPQLPLG